MTISRLFARTCRLFAISVIASFSLPLYATPTLVDTPEKPDLHCGSQPDIALYEGLMKPWSEDNDTNDVGLNAEHLHGRTLELVMHFEANSSEIPEDCKATLLSISQAAKTKKLGHLLIRSSTRTNSSMELDLANASERLEAIKDFFRNDRLARKLLILEVLPISTTPILNEPVETLRIVEIYSSPAD
jgi:hypothetical protein